MAAVTALIPLAGNVAAAVLTDWTGRAGWLVVPAVGVVVAMITALVEAYGGAGTEGSSHQRDDAGRPVDVDAGSRPPQEQGRTPLVVALVIAVVVIGLGGLGVAEGTRSLVIAEKDLPEEYEPVRSKRSSSVSTCASIRGFPAAARSLKTTLTALGLERCELRQYARTVGDERSSATNRPTSQAFVMRDEAAAAKLLPVLRRLFLATIDPDGTVASTPHSLPTPILGAEAPRGLKLTFNSPSFPTGRMTQWVYFWRRGNVAAWVGATDTVGDFDRLTTLDLARSVDARILD